MYLYVQYTKNNIVHNTIYYVYIIYYYYKDFHQFDAQ